MRSIFKISCVVVLLFSLTSLAAAKDMTMNGRISDSKCNASHSAMQQQHAQEPLSGSDHDCTLTCVKAGAQYVFVSGGKIYKIANQDDPDLEKNAGRNIQLTGDMSSSGIITVSKIEMPEKKS